MTHQSPSGRDPEAVLKDSAESIAPNREAQADVRQTTVEAQLQQTEEAQLLDALLVGRSQLQKAVVKLRASGLTSPEIDEHLGLEPGTTRREFHAAVKGMKAEYCGRSS